MSPKPRKRMGRPPLPMPEPIPDTPENVAKAVLTSRPKKADEWRYMRDHREGKLK